MPRPDRPGGDEMGGAEFGALLSSLVEQLESAGVSPGQALSDIQDVLGNTADGRTRNQIAKELQLWVAGLPLA